jgi:hypothetical protein
MKGRFSGTMDRSAPFHPGTPFIHFHLAPLRRHVAGAPPTSTSIPRHRPYFTSSWGAALSSVNAGGNSGYVVEYSGFSESDARSSASGPQSQIHSTASTDLRTFAQSSQFESALNFAGECTRKVGDVEDRGYCDSSIMNLRFKHGYLSFQFSSKERLSNGKYKEAVSFVGPGLTQQDVNGAKITYLPVEELTFFEGANGRLDNHKVNDSACILTFDGTEVTPSALTKLQCQYKQNGIDTVFIATNMKLQKLPNGDK